MSIKLFTYDIKLYKKANQEIQRQIKKYNIRIHKKKFRTNVGRAWVHLSLVKIPFVQDIESIYIIFHEIGHIRHNHDDKKWNYLQELQAESYALAQLRSIGVKQLYPKEYKEVHERAKYYVMRNILYDIELGLKVKDISIQALKFCNLKKQK
jgi:hypothetical protein